MAKTDSERLRHNLEILLAETGARIRRYTLDRKLSDTALPQINAIWDEWLQVRRNLYALPVAADDAQFRAVEEALLTVDRKVDLVQRALVSGESLTAGIWTTAWLAGALVALVAVYLYSHGVRSFDLSGFEPIAEWGPLKYVEVAFWSAFGVLCTLLALAAYYVLRRDFDAWYRPWYVSTALRAPFVTVILMIVVLEFTEWYGEGTWIETTLLEEGNKSYFIAFMSFCLGLLSDQAAAIVGDLADGVIQFVRAVVQRVSSKLSTAVLPDVTRSK